MTLGYANPTVPTAPLRSRGRTGFTLVLFLLFAISATLCIRAMRWDRWANYEDTHRPWLDGFGGESYSSFKTWRAWRTSWERSLTAVVLSGAAVVTGLVVALATWHRAGLSKWLLLAILLHAVPIAYFVIRWGPDFRHPRPEWGG